jgi:hypothetical protein
MVAILLVAMPLHLEGFAPARRWQTIPIPTMNKSVTVTFDREITLNSSVATPISIMESQGSLNSIQATVVKFLMVAYIASMCVALPA